MGHGLGVMTSPKEPLFMAGQVATGFMPKKCLLTTMALGQGHGLTAASLTLVGVTGLVPHKYSPMVLPALGVA